MLLNGGELEGIRLMTQFMPAFVIYPAERQFKVLAYQAIVD